MVEIGGFFGLEAQRRSSPHSNSISFNTARSALCALLRVLDIGEEVGDGRLFLPVFNCTDVYSAIISKFPHIRIQFYNITEGFEPILEHDFDQNIDRLYILNFCGLTQDILMNAPDGSIVDNVQSFFQPPLRGMHTLYSARKFFGVPDGGYLYTDVSVPVPISATTWDSSNHLLKRLDLSASASYADYLEAEQRLSVAGVLGMSNLSKVIMDSVDLDLVARVRLNNFNFLHSELGQANKLSKKIDLALLNADFVPFSYPLYIEKGGELRVFLIANKVFVPQFWRCLLDTPLISSFEADLVRNVVYLPIDQRYLIEDMEALVKIIRLLGLPEAD